MRIISRARLRRFWETRKAGSAIAERDMTAWYKLARNSDWANFAALKQTFGSADRVGNCVVFDVGNNRFRVIGRVMYDKGVIYVLKVMDHPEYDKKLWIGECGCHRPPPKKPAAARKAPPRGRPAPRGRKGG